MPCCSIILTGPRKGTACRNETRLGVRCGTHSRTFNVAPVVAAAKEIRAFVDGWKMREFNLITLSNAITWRNNRIAEICATAPPVIANMSFPYGNAVPDFNNLPMPEDVEFVIVEDNAPAPRPRRRNPPRPRRHNNVDELNNRFRAEHAAEFFEAPPRAHVPRAVDDVLERNRAARAERPMREFAADKQNIHTTQVVDMTKSVVERVLRIPVPFEYQWNMNTVSKTVGEIIVECSMTLNEMIEMMNRYVRDDDVYDMGKGIYGKVLDGVWQYIRNSSDKTDLCRILKQELKDNIGMCAQGNLTRLCNVLAGYMDGIGPQESVSERLGRELPLLMDDEDRITKAKALMMSLNVPETEWGAWLDALTV